jgi:acetolactate synthase-1/2/3 large subunit
MEEVSHLIARFLVERGVDRVFSLCGGHILPIWDHAHQLGIRVIDVRDERAAVHMAHAHRELTGCLGVAIVTAGPGLTNAVTGIANAHVSRVPILVISGVPPRPQENMGALQGISHVDIVRSITRYARTISQAGHVLRELDEAVAAAEGHCGEPGPAFIDFPTDVLRENIPESLVDHRHLTVRGVHLQTPSADAVESAAKMLCAASRLLVISGRGSKGAGEPLRQFLDQMGCVYLDTGESRGLISQDHPAFMPAVRGRAMGEADVVVTLGRTLDFQLGYGSPAVFPDARFVRIGTTAGELRVNRRADVEVFGSPALALGALLAAVDKPPATDEAWIADMRNQDRERRKKLQRRLIEAQPGSDGAMHPYRLLGCIRDCLKPDAVVIADGGDFLSFSRIALTGSDYLDCGAFGCLGVGVPFGIASALAFPERQVVVVTGDGSFGFNAVELDTCRRHGARVVFVVANNAGWNIERNDQRLAFEERIIGTELKGCDYAAFAQSLGVHGERVEDPEKLPEALERAFDRAPALLDVVVTRDATSPDAVSGLPGIPDLQALSGWDKLEKVRWGR